jgi:hypothetical protein
MYSDSVSFPRKEMSQGGKKDGIEGDKLKGQGLRPTNIFLRF